MEYPLEEDMERLRIRHTIEKVQSIECVVVFMRLKNITSKDQQVINNIQVGVHLVCVSGGLHVKQVYFSKNWVSAQLTRSTWFVGSEYPLSSLVRLMKYYARGNFERSTAISSVLAVVLAILKRGFKDYDDFKDQLDAVDLGYVEGVIGVQSDQLYELFIQLSNEDRNLLRKQVESQAITISKLEEKLKALSPHPTVEG